MPAGAGDHFKREAEKDHPPRFLGIGDAHVLHAFDEIADRSLTVDATEHALLP